MKRVTLCALISALSSVPALADSYQAEVGAQYFNFDGGNDDVDAYGLSGEVFFAPVNTSKGPLAEASFLDHASGLFASWTDIDEVDDDVVGLGLRVVTEGDFIVEASFVEASFVEASFVDGGETETVGLGLGLYLNDTTDLVFSYATNDDADLDTVSADLHSVVGLGADMSLAYTVVATYIDANADDGYALAGDITLYINDQLGLSANLGYEEVDSFDVTTVGVGVDYFILPNFRVSATYANDDFDGGDIDTLGLAASLRF